MATPTAPEILDRARGHIADRAKTRDRPDGERSMACCVAIFNAWTGHRLTESDGWRFMAALKQAREVQGEHNIDDYEDGASYFALLGEHCAAMALKTGK